ncbi:transposase domain-containing protein [Mesorhizobium sp.]|uniref:transposase domain-containing protein n=1 Tax=Mesorhizobium sp. TaxID=1871066 RepID=UPI0025F93AE6|nr:transposase domain-containing protein [Mesorhizobium sp.]
MAVVASLIETRKFNGVEPLSYLADVLTEIVDGHPTARSTISCLGPTSGLPRSEPWPEDTAYPVKLGDQDSIPETTPSATHRVMYSGTPK